MRLYWWKSHHHPLGNWGDELNPLIMHKLEQSFEWDSPCEAELVMVGSILEHLPRHWAGTVCGAGKLYEDSRIHLPDARVFALRGELTKAGVTGLRGPVVLGDPGLLLPRWIRQPQAKHDLGVLPHWSDKELWRKYCYGRYINPNQPAEKVIQEIISCKRIITSSLHGVIVSDAFGIPRQAELFPQAVNEGGDFKFRDYASVYDEHPHFGHMHRVPRHKVEKIQDELFRALQIAVGIDLPSDVEERRDPQMSLLVPFRDDGEHRSRVWRWLRQYWRARGMSAEIIQGHDDSSPFSKAKAVNMAASLARGRVFVVLDADAYMAPWALEECANNIEQALRAGKHTWYMPYNHLYRLNKDYTTKLLKSNSEASPITATPPKTWLDPAPPGAFSNGHQYGAMAQIMPREAFYRVNGLHSSFSGWGSEDSSFLKSLDTLWGHHEVAENQILHLWHERIGHNWATRKWIGQNWETANSRLAQRHAMAYGELGAMQGLADEHPLPPSLYY